MNDDDLHRRWRSKLAEIGTENVRIQLASNVHIAEVERGFAWRWLKEQDEKRQLDADWYAKWIFGLTVVAAIAGVLAALTGIVAIRDFIRDFF